MVKIERVKEVNAALKKLQNKSAREDNGSVIVGYTANYAVYVHESVGEVLKGMPRPKRKGSKADRGFYWDPQGQAQSKFLERPARELSSELGRIVRTIKQRGGTLIQGLLMAGNRLQAESQRRVPVDTGNLKASAFTRKE